MGFVHAHGFLQYTATGDGPATIEVDIPLSKQCIFRAPRAATQEEIYATFCMPCSTSQWPGRLGDVKDTLLKEKVLSKAGSGAVGGRHPDWHN